jgi:hypothetical protein
MEAEEKKVDQKNTIVEMKERKLILGVKSVTPDINVRRERTESTCRFLLKIYDKAKVKQITTSSSSSSL